MMATEGNKESTDNPNASMTRAESLVVVQTCLRGCVSAVLHARQLLPQRAFRREKVTFSDKLDEKDAVTMILLRDGPSQRATSLLHWLHNGVFGALRQGYLSGFQICIHPDPVRRAHTLETYTFTIQYIATPDGKLVPDTISLAAVDEGNEAVLVNNAGKDLYKTLKTITDLCESIPALPRDRFLSMNLFLLPHAEDLNSIEGFTSARRELLVWPNHNEWARQTEAFHTLSANLTSTRLKVSYMATTHERAGHQPGMTDLREYTKDISMTDDIDWILAKIHAKPKREPVTRGAGRPSLASQGARHSLLDSKSRSSFGYGMPNSPRSHALQQDDTEENESQKTVAHIKTALNAMAQPETFTQGDTQAASLPSAPQHPIPDNVKLEYNYGNLYHERTTTQIIQHQAKELAKEIGGLTRSGQIILCQCGYSKEEGDMMRCTNCHTWQHTHCYGYVSKDDPRRPSEHLCYLCFVDPHDPKRLKALIDLAVERRAIFESVRNGVMGKGDFADKLGMDGSIAHPLFEKLKEEGYLVPASGSHKAGFKNSGKPPWVPAAGDASTHKMLDEYFNPIHNVEEYFEPCTFYPSWIADKLAIPRAAELPNAATPLAERQKRKRATAAQKAAQSRAAAAAKEELASPGRVTRQGRIYQTGEDDEYGSTDTDEDLPVNKQARGGARKNDKNATPTRRKLINLESDRIIDVSASSGRV